MLQSRHFQLQSPPAWYRVRAKVVLEHHFNPCHPLGKPTALVLASMARLDRVGSNLF